MHIPRDQILLAIAIEIGNGRGPVAIATAEGLWRLESSIPVAQQQRNRTVSLVGHSQILLALALEVAYGHARRVSAYTVVLSRLERSIAVAQQHGDIVGSFVVYGQIGLAVIVEVAHGYPYRTCAHCVCLCGLEGPVAVAQQHRNGCPLSAGAIIGHRKIQFAITIEVACSHKERTGAHSKSLCRLEGPSAAA